MKNTTIMIAVSKDAPVNALAAKLETIRAIPAQVSVLVVGEVPQFPYYAVGVPPYGGVDIEHLAESLLLQCEPLPIHPSPAGMASRTIREQGRPEGQARRDRNTAPEP